MLVGALPLAFALSSEGLAPMQLDERQREEVFLTSAQPVFGHVVIANYRFGLGEALTLFVLFALEPFFTSTEARWFYAILYLLLAAGMIAFKRNTRQAVFNMCTPWRGAPT